MNYWILYTDAWGLRFSLALCEDDTPLNAALLYVLWFRFLICLISPDVMPVFVDFSSVNLGQIVWERDRLTRITYSRSSLQALLSSWGFRYISTTWLRAFDVDVSVFTRFIRAWSSFEGKRTSAGTCVGKGDVKDDWNEVKSSEGK